MGACSYLNLDFIIIHRILITLVTPFLKRQITITIQFFVTTILGDPGADRGGKEGSLNGRKKSIEGRDEPLETTSRGDSCQKFFVFFCPIRGQQAMKSFRVFLHESHLIAILALGLLRVRNVSITARNVQGIVRNIGG